EAILPEEAPEGVLVGVPSRDALIALPVHPRTLQHLALLKVFLANQHQDAAYPITPDIFWVRQGRWRRLGVELSDQGIQLDPTEALIDELHQLLVAADDDRLQAPVPLRLREEDYEAPGEVPFTSPAEQADYRRGHRAGWQAFADNAQTYVKPDGYQGGYIPG